MLTNKADVLVELKRLPEALEVYNLAISSTEIF